ncbi:MAG TPA: MlaD family protein [Bryobacteraceae bacterium]|nr:MlaD family protein [Bryobacteraceae bacterium]
MPSADRVAWAQFRVGLVAVVALIILGVLLYLLTGGMLFHERSTLYLYVPDATGIGPGSPVEVDGIPVGKVSSVALSGSADPMRVVRVTFWVPRSMLQTIPAESFAQLSVSSPVGDKYVDITRQGTGIRRPGTEVAYKEQPDLFKSLDLTGLEKQLRDVDALLADIQSGRSALGQFVLGREMYDDLRRRFAEIEQSVRKAANTTTPIGQALYTDRLYRRMLEPVQALDQTLAKIQSGQGMGQLLRDTGTYAELRSTVHDLQQSVATLAASPFFQSDETYREWNRTVSSLIESVQQFNTSPMMTTSQMYDNLNGAARQFLGTMRDFHTNPRKYLKFKIF